MVTGREIWWQVLKTAWISYRVLASLVGLVIIIAWVWGVEHPMLWPYLDYGWVRVGLLLLFIVYVFWVIVEIAYPVIKEDREKSEQDFFSTHPEIRTDRAYRLIHQLWKAGDVLKTAGLERQQQWDLEVRQKLATYCPQALRRYLIETGRGASENPLTSLPLRQEYYGHALHALSDFLDENLMFS